MNIADMFRSMVPGQSNSGTQQQHQPTPPGNIQPTTANTSATVSTPNTAPNGVVPATVTPESKTEETKSPLDSFASLWDNKDVPPNPSKDPIFNIKPEDVSAAAKKVDFTKSITADHLAAIGKGGEEAVKVFASILNNVAQDVYAQSALATTKLIESGIQKSTGNFRNELPSIIKNHTMSDSLRSENKAFSHPAVTPLISAVENQLTVKYPNATSSELKAMAVDYVNSAFNAMNPPKPDTKTNDNKNEPDWSSYL